MLHVVGPGGGGATALTIDGDGGTGDLPVRVRDQGGVDKCYIKGDGDLENQNNNYGAFSDAILKQDIRPAKSQWDDIKRIKLQNYRLKAQARDNADCPLHLGLIAQETEQVAPGLVSRNIDGLRSIKYSILHLKALGALQEAMSRIEKLERVLLDGIEKSASPKTP